MSVRLTKVASNPLVYVVLFAAYPVVFLWSRNRRLDVSTLSVLTVLGLMVAGGLLVFALFFLLFRDRARAGIAAAILIGLFATFGHVEGILSVGGGTLGELVSSWRGFYLASRRSSRPAA